MSQFIESICMIDGKPCHLGVHQQRVDSVFNSFFQESHVLDLQEYINSIPQIEGKAKLRVEYGSEEISHSIEPYTPRPVKSLQIVPALIDYRFKYKDRSRLEKLHSLRADADDILILCNNEITDTYYANIALRKDGEWYTPKSYLLNGVKRQVLLQERRIIETTVTLDDLAAYEAVSLINAMLDLGEVVVKTENILY